MEWTKNDTKVDSTGLRRRSCLTMDHFDYLFTFLGNQSSEQLHRALLNLSCANITDYNDNGTDDLIRIFSGSDVSKAEVDFSQTALDVYAYVTPIVIAVGFVGNVISLRVFLSRRMRQMSASLYLACLAMSDILVLMTYGLFEWLDRGLPRWPDSRSVDIKTVSGLCQVYMFTVYLFRFTSAWFIVAFTIERYIGICMPLRRRTHFRRTFARRSLFTVAGSAVCISIVKPLLFTVREFGPTARRCTWKPGYQVHNFVYDSVYGALITVVPFVVMVTLNLLICRKLRRAKRCTAMRHRFVTEESNIRLEFTAILLLVSTMFIVLNLPYFVSFWCHNFFAQLNQTFPQLGQVLALKDTDRSRGWLYITKTIFFGNYCINFFIYSLSGAYFRRQLKRLVTCHHDTWSSEFPTSRYNIRQAYSVTSMPVMVSKL